MISIEKLKLNLILKQDPHCIEQKIYTYGFDEDVDIAPKQCIYFIICNGYCVYVGQSTNINCRIATHKRHLVFDKVIIQILMEDDDMNLAERYWIQRILPPLNGSFVPFENRHSGGPLKYKDVKKICDKHREETYSLG